MRAAKAAGVNAKWLRAASALLPSCLRLQCETGVILALLPVHLCCSMVPLGMARVHKAQTSDHFGPLPNGDGGGRDGRGLSVHRRGSVLLMIAPDCVFLSDRARSKGHR